MWAIFLSSQGQGLSCTKIQECGKAYLALALPADPWRNGPPKTLPFDNQELIGNLNFLIKALPQPPSGSNSCCEVVNFWRLLMCFYLVWGETWLLPASSPNTAVSQLIPACHGSPQAVDSSASACHDQMAKELLPGARSSPEQPFQDQRSLGRACMAASRHCQVQSIDPMFAVKRNWSHALIRRSSSGERSQGEVSSFCPRWVATAGSFLCTIDFKQSFVWKILLDYGKKAFYNPPANAVMFTDRPLLSLTDNT